MPEHSGLCPSLCSLTVAGAVSALPAIAERTDFPFHPSAMASGHLKRRYLARVKDERQLH